MEKRLVYLFLVFRGLTVQSRHLDLLEATGPVPVAARSKA